MGGWGLPLEESLGLNCAWYADILLTLTAAPSISALNAVGLGQYESGGRRPAPLCAGSIRCGQIGADLRRLGTSCSGRRRQQVPLSVLLFGSRHDRMSATGDGMDTSHPMNRHRGARKVAEYR